MSNIREGDLPEGLGALVDPESCVDFAALWARFQPFTFRCGTKLHSALAKEFANAESLAAAGGVFRIGDASIAEGLRFASADEAAATITAAEKTVVSQQVDRAIPWIADWILSFLEETALPVSQAKANVFCSPPTSGLARHFDNHEVVIVGLSGEKHFRVAPCAVVQHPMFNDDRYEDPNGALARERESSTLDGEEIITIKAGDALHIPRGWWHATEAEEATVSITFGFWSATTGDVVGDVPMDADLSRVPVILESAGALQQRAIEQTLTLASVRLPDLSIRLTKLALASQFRYQSGLA